jgi:hypothetical protein
MTSLIQAVLGDCALSMSTAAWSASHSRLRISLCSNSSSAQLISSSAATSTVRRSSRTPSSRCQRRVEPSMSVNRKVTVPDGELTPVASHVGALAAQDLPVIRPHSAFLSQPNDRNQIQALVAFHDKHPPGVGSRAERTHQHRTGIAARPISVPIQAKV